MKKLCNPENKHRVTPWSSFGAVKFGYHFVDKVQIFPVDMAGPTSKPFPSQPPFLHPTLSRIIKKNTSNVLWQPWPGGQGNVLSSFYGIIWRAQWNNRISPTTMKQRKSPVKPVTQKNIQSCLVLPPEIMHDAIMLFSECLPIYVSSCMTISVGRTEQLDTIAGFLLHHWLYEWFLSAKNIHRYMRRAWRSRVEELNNTL